MAMRARQRAEAAEHAMSQELDRVVVNFRRRKAC
jgi:hypothetical protein